MPRLHAVAMLLMSTALDVADDRHDVATPDDYVAMLRYA